MLSLCALLEYHAWPPSWLRVVPLIMAALYVTGCCPTQLDMAYRAQAAALLQALKNRAALHWGGKALRGALAAWGDYMGRRRAAKAQAQRALQHWSMLGLARVGPVQQYTWLCCVWLVAQPWPAAAT